MDKIVEHLYLNAGHVFPIPCAVSHSDKLRDTVRFEKQNPIAFAEISGRDGGIGSALHAGSSRSIMFKER